MKTKWNSLPVKLSLVAVLALLLLIPLALVKGQIEDRQNASDTSIYEVSRDWGLQQTLTGPSLQLSFLEQPSGKDKPELKTVSVYPKELDYEIEAHTQTLHRSIYDVLVYKADVVMTGSFIVPETYGTKELEAQVLTVGVTDLRGIEGDAEYSLGTRSGCCQEASTLTQGIQDKGILKEAVRLERSELDGKTAIPFRIVYKIRGSSELMVRPYGESTRVSMRADSPNPSFSGDFLPAERTVTEEGFSASWAVSKINRGDPDACSFGVKMLQDVTQYQQSMRSAKYGILVILLVFLAALAAELVTKRPINLVQYAVVGLSLVLFYALVLAFSEFMAFHWAYLLSALMTVAALTCYFRAILRNRAAYVLGALTAVAFFLSYILLQMKTYAFLSGTLLLFVLLAAIMYFTRNLAATPPTEE